MCPRTVGCTAGVLLVLAAMTVFLAAGPVVAATPGELLQKAIYTEETVGNLDEAMKLYEQVIADGNAGQEAAAQAQYRLALCYEKKGHDADAKAAFEALIENYPNAKDLVAEARKHLPTKELKLLPAPWKLGERMQLNMKLPTGLPIGTMIYKVDAAKHDGKDATRCSTRGLVTINGASSYSDVLCDTDTFAPIESFWKHSLLGEARAEYGESSVKIDVVGKDKPFTIAFEPPVFDNEECVELFRRLPLAAGYKTTLSVITSLGGNQIRIPVSVVATESITVPAGKFECYKLELGLVNQMFWISNDEHRYVVRFAAGGVTADLTKVWQAEPGIGEKVGGDGFSLALPEGWLSYEAGNPAKPDEIQVLLLDPRAVARCEVSVRPKSSLKEAQQASTKAWTESFIKDFKEGYADFHVVEPGLVDKNVGGQAATEIVADFTDGGKKKRLLGVAVIRDKSAATLSFVTETTDFDELRGAFDAIVENFQLK
jgi:hypothetical protein